MEWLHGFSRIYGGVAFRGILVSTITLVCALALGKLICFILFRIFGSIAKRTPGEWDDVVLDGIHAPARWLIPLLLVKLAIGATELPLALTIVLSHVMSLALLGSISFLCVRIIRLFRIMLLSRYDLTAADNLSARKIHTQVKVLEKALLSLVGLATLAFMLMTFDGIRQVGVSILASAGLAGVILGLAAQKSLGTLLAGLQIALTQPIRMDDVVIVEEEWGRIEEITLTYVVVRIWDLRRLVVPITHFIEKPFQNWTRASSDILGTVMIYVDYGVPVESVRAELRSIVESTPLWDRKECGVQITEWKERSLEMRLLVSAANASDAWDLRCLIRERMIGFIRKAHPESLPKLRILGEK